MKVTKTLRINHRKNKGGMREKASKAVARENAQLSVEEKHEKFYGCSFCGCSGRWVSCEAGR